MNPEALLTKPRRPEIVVEARAERRIADLTERLKKANKKIHDQRAQLRSLHMKWATVQFLRENGVDAQLLAKSIRLRQLPEMEDAIDSIRAGNAERALTSLGKAASLI